MLSDAEYLKSLPRKHIGCAALFFNEKDELLIVKPNYKSGWLVPGGVIDALESPYAACVREIKEEIGLDISHLVFLGVGYSKDPAREGIPSYDSIHFTFLGGTLTREQIANIVLQKSELDEYKFCPRDEALSLLRPKLSARVRAAFDAMARGVPVYTENEK